jgi:integrase
MNIPDNDDVNAKAQDRHDPSTRKASREARNQRGPIPPKSRRSSPTLREAVEGYLQKREQKVESEQLSKRTLNTDRRSLKLLLEWFEENHGTVTAPESVGIGLREFKEFRLRSVSPTTVAKNLSHVKSFFSELVSRGKVDSNPAKRIDIPDSRERTEVPTESEFKDIKTWVDDQIESCDEPAWIHLLMKLACRTGMRLGELVQVKWQRGPRDVGTGDARNYVYLDSEERTITIKFKRKLRVIPADQVWGVFDLLWERSEPGDEYVFASPNGGHYDDSYVCNRWKKEIRKVPSLSVHYTCHCIRHAVVTSLLRKDYTAHKVGQLVGHSSEQITERYAHLIPSDLSEMTGDLG